MYLKPVFIATLAFASCPVFAAGDGGEPPSLTLDALASGFGPAQPRHGGQMAAITLRIKGDAVRVDFRGDRGDSGYLLFDNRTRKGWFVAEGDGFALPMTQTGFEALLVDPSEPCARIQARCERTQGETIAGIAAEGWRYHNAGGRGPDGTSQGTFWMDPASGLMLAYRGQVAGQQNRREMRGLSLSRAPLADSVFHLSDRIPVLDATRGSSGRR